MVVKGGLPISAAPEFHPSKNPAVFLNILLRAPNWLGDTMMATPAVCAVRRMFPKARLSILAKPATADFWKNFPGVSGFVGLEKGLAGFGRTVEALRKGGFDAALILPASFSSAFLAFAAGIPERIGWGGEGRELLLTRVVPHAQPRQKHLVLEYLELVRDGLETPLPGPRAGLYGPVTRESARELERLLKEEKVAGRAFIALGPGATYGPAKRWPLPYWGQLVRKLLAGRKETLLIIGGPEERAYLEPLLSEGGGAPGRLRLLAGRTPPPVLLALLSRCRLLVTNDTGPMHAAAAVGTPTVALFGSTSPLWTRPFGQGHEVVYKELECSPCFQKTCPIGYKCLHAITVEDVFTAVMGRLRKPGRVREEKLPEGFGKRP